MVNSSIPIIPVTPSEFTTWLNKQPIAIKKLTAIHKFTAKPNTFCLLNDQHGELKQVLLGIENRQELLAFGILPTVLPKAIYEIAPLSNWTITELQNAAIAWRLGCYSFSKYKANAPVAAKLAIPKHANTKEIDTIVAAISLVRDLINTPADDMRPADFAAVARNIAKQHRAKYRCLVGKDLIKANFPAVYAVGKGSVNPPMLIELRWQHVAKNAPRVTLVGKGVCFDSGGLDIKTPGGMLLMKKDMAGAAHALALAQMLMTSKLPLNLRIIIPLVENLISGDSLKPGDILKMRNGKTVEIKNTDAEGRLVLADALSFAVEEPVDLLIDFATLTGAARTALGSKVAALFTPNDDLALAIDKATQAANEAVWRLPLYKPYRQLLQGKISDLLNISSSEANGAGAITAALFLQEFVAANKNWLHLDMTAYNFSSSPAKPEGGEAMCLQGIYQYLKQLAAR